MAKPQKSTAQSEVPGLVKKGPLYYLKRDWQLYALMLLPILSNRGCGQGISASTSLATMTRNWHICRHTAAIPTACVPI